MVGRIYTYRVQCPQCGEFRDRRACGPGQAAKRKFRACTRTHGISHSRLYKMWDSMMQRCGHWKGASAQTLAAYAERGIIVCEEWRKSSVAFIEWAFVNGYRNDLEIERRNNDGPYSPGNCRFATRREQMRNTRSTRLITAFGRTHPLAAWADETGLKPDTITERIKRGWRVEDALSKPPGHRP